MKPPGKANARRQPGERVSKLTDNTKLRKRVRHVNASYGPPELCAWQVAPGVFWIQTTEPRFSRKLEKRADIRRVAVDGVNHYRHTFELQGTWRKIRRIIDRYLVSAGDQFSPDSLAAIASKIAASISTAGSTIEGQK
jgi:hypothetical protein